MAESDVTSRERVSAERIEYVVGWMESMARSAGAALLAALYNESAACLRELLELRTAHESLKRRHTQQLACIQIIAQGDEPNIVSEFPAANDVRLLRDKLRVLRAATPEPEARPAPTNAQHEPGYPAHETVAMSLRYPMLTAHQPSERCSTQEPHAIAECGEFEPEAREPEGAACYDCREPYDSPRFPDLVVPHEIWNNHLSPKGTEGGLLCPNCMCARAERAGLRNVPAHFRSGAFACDPTAADGEGLTPNAVSMLRRAADYVVAFLGGFDWEPGSEGRDGRNAEECAKILQHWMRRIAAARPVPAAPGTPDWLQTRHLNGVAGIYDVFASAEDAIQQLITYIREREPEFPAASPETPPAGETPMSTVTQFNDGACIHGVAWNRVCDSCRPGAGYAPPAPVPMGLGQEHAEAINRILDAAAWGRVLPQEDAVRCAELCRVVRDAIATREPTPEWVAEWCDLLAQYRIAFRNHYDVPTQANRREYIEAEAALDAHVGVRHESEVQDG